VSGAFGLDNTRAAAKRERVFLAVLAAAGLLLADAAVFGTPRASEHESETLSNPFRGQEDAIEQGRRIYRSKCIICHQQTGGRAKNLFKTKLTDEEFLNVVINGRKGTLMPAFGYRLSPDEVWQVHAYVQSRDVYD
jgi:mono/diheme cytochrome c family protein